MPPTVSGRIGRRGHHGATPSGRAGRPLAASAAAPSSGYGRPGNRRLLRAFVDSQARAYAQCRLAVAGRDAEDVGRLVDRSARRRTGASPVRPPAGRRRPAGRGPRRRRARPRPSRRRRRGLVQVVTRAVSPPRLAAFFRRAFSTRMRRMASAAAAKKCRRFAQSRPASAPATRRYASWTRAVGVRVCPVGSAAIRAASRRRSSYTSGSGLPRIARRQPCDANWSTRVMSLITGV